MVVALPLMDRVAGAAAAALADELGWVGEGADVPDEPDEVPDPPDAVPEPGEVLVPDEVLVPGELLAPDEASWIPGAFVCTSTDAGEHPNNVADETNTAAMPLGSFMRPLLAERFPYVVERRHFHGYKSVVGSRPMRRVVMAFGTPQ